MIIGSPARTAIRAHNHLIDADISGYQMLWVVRVNSHHTGDNERAVVGSPLSQLAQADIRILKRERGLIDPSNFGEAVEPVTVRIDLVGRDVNRRVIRWSGDIDSSRHTRHLERQWRRLESPGSVLTVFIARKDV